MKILDTLWFFLLFLLGQGIIAGARDSNVFGEELVEKGSFLFLKYCAHCHGLKGRGDGYNAEFLEKEPANLSDPDFMGKKKDNQIFRAIQKGGVGVRKSHLMPVFGYTLSEGEIWSLVAYVRTLSGGKIQSIPIPDTIVNDKPKGFNPSHNDVKKFSVWFPKELDKTLIDAGEKLFKKKKSCLACHKIKKGQDEEENNEEDRDDDSRTEGGHVGPDLSRAGFEFPPDWLYVWLKNPQSPKPNTKMPNLGLDDDEIKLVIAYLSSLKDIGLPEEWKPYLSVKGNPEKGKKLYFNPKSQANCVECHSINKKGGVVGPDLGFIGSARTLPFLLESILDPNKVITAGYSKVTLLFKNKYQGKRTLTGALANEDDTSIELIDKNEEIHRFSKEKILKIFTKPSEMMQKNFDKKLNVGEVRDILAYLKTLKWPTLEGIDVKSQ